MTPETCETCGRKIPNQVLEKHESGCDGDAGMIESTPHDDE